MKIHQKIGRNRIIITESYSERIRFNRREMFACYDLKVTPNSSNTISIAHDDSVDQRYLSRLPYYLPKYIDKFQKLDISVSGLEFMLTNHTINAMDSKPVSYDASIFLSLKAWIDSGNVKFNVVEPKLRCNQYRFELTEESIKFLNKIYKETTVIENRLYFDNTLGIRNNYKLYLSESNLKINIQNKYDIDYEFENNRRNLNINLYFKTDEFSFGEIQMIKKAMEKVSKTIYDNQINLRGFEIFFSKIEQSINFDDIVVLNFEWAIRNLLTSKESVLQINETSR